MAVHLPIENGIQNQPWVYMCDDPYSLPDLHTV